MGLHSTKGSGFLSVLAVELCCVVYHASRSSLCGLCFDLPYVNIHLTDGSFPRALPCHPPRGRSQAPGLRPGSLPPRLPPGSLSPRGLPPGSLPPRGLPPRQPAAKVPPQQPASKACPQRSVLLSVGVHIVMLLYPTVM